MGEPTADLREGLQEARVEALPDREEKRRQNYKAPRRAAGRHRLLDVGVFNSTLAMHFTNSAASSLKCFTEITLSSMRVAVLFDFLFLARKISRELDAIGTVLSSNAVMYQSNMFGLPSASARASSRSPAPAETAAAPAGGPAARARCRASTRLAATERMRR